MAETQHVVVAGGGWAGLAAAVELARNGVRVTLLESAKQTGGRARRVLFDDMGIDNGQHIMVGAYHHLLDLLDTLNVAEESVVIRRQFSLQMISPESGEVQIQPSSLPVPLHLLRGLTTASGLSLKERFKAIRMAVHMVLSRYRLATDVSVMAYLLKNRQPHRVIKTLWEPLCVAALNTPIHEASARMFLQVLKNVFTHLHENSDLLIPHTDLGSVIPGPAMDYIERHGGSVRLSQRVSGLQIADNRISGVWVGDSLIEADHVIIATPHTIARRLMNPFDAFNAITDALAKLKDSPTCTLYIKYPPDTRLKDIMIGMFNTTSQWVFDRRFCSQPGLLSVVISGDGPHMTMTNEKLTDLVVSELSACFPQLPLPESTLVIREKRATFNCHVDVDTLRPDITTPVKGCWLAGDYTTTGLPATLEGAVKSGVQCARHIIRPDSQA